MRRRRQQHGSTILEFVFTAIPLIFVTIGIFQMSLSMWQYHTLQYAAKEATSYLSVHGASYVAAAGAPIQIKDVATVLAANAVGIRPNAVSVTFKANASTKTCRLDNCATDTTSWPPAAANSLGTDITIRADITLTSALGMWTPGSGSVAFANSYGFPGYSHQQIVF